MTDETGADEGRGVANRPRVPYVRPRPRRPWLAAILAFVVPGLGHLYLGRPRAALAIYALWFALPFALIVAAVLLEVNLAVVSALTLILTLGVWIGQMVSAVQGARRSPISFQRGRVNHVALYITFALASFGINAAGSELLTDQVVESFNVPSSSMLPSILQGETFFVVKIGGANAPINRGDVVVFEAPEGGSDYVKRVVALGGDTVEQRGDEVLVNGQPLERTPCSPPTAVYTQYDIETAEVTTQEMACWRETSADGVAYELVLDPRAELFPRDHGPERVPADALWVLGDNRRDSYDSRLFGPVPRSNVVGRTDVVYWSRRPGGGFRLERLGQRVR